MKFKVQLELILGVNPDDFEYSSEEAIKFWLKDTMEDGLKILLKMLRFKTDQSLDTEERIKVTSMERIEEKDN